MVSHICLLVELGPICNSMAALLCLKSCEDHSLLKSYNGGLWKNIYRSGPLSVNCFCLHTTVMLTVCYINRQPGIGYHYSDTNACGESAESNKEIVNLAFVYCYSIFVASRNIYSTKKVKEKVFEGL